MYYLTRGSGSQLEMAKSAQVTTAPDAPFVDGGSIAGRRAPEVSQHSCFGPVWCNTPRGKAQRQQAVQPRMSSDAGALAWRSVVLK